ncbi:hypothetical protein Tco_1003294 [Tanacetum coccineum]|uniref:Uncharacterized protein n=1 Tax=Tanacetum coccineum TaxID=301880 RepID=A0ABQ5F8N9_9ASTR
MDPAIVMCKNSGHREDGEKIMELGTMDMDGSATEKMDNGDDGREGDEGTRLKIKVLIRMESVEALETEVNFGSNNAYLDEIEKAFRVLDN